MRNKKKKRKKILIFIKIYMRLYLFIAYRACYTDYSYIEKRKEKRNVEKKKETWKRKMKIFFL